jgi:rhodanese-related sulfurtransferase
VLVCRSGARSAGAARVLVEAGFLRVMNLAGRLIAYRAADLPVELG